MSPHSDLKIFIDGVFETQWINFLPLVSEYLITVFLTSMELKANVSCFLPPQRAKKRVRVNSVATKLLSQLPTKGAIDLSYLLENNKRQRKKTAAFTS